MSERTFGDVLCGGEECDRAVVCGVVWCGVV